MNSEITRLLLKFEYKNEIYYACKFFYKNTIVNMTVFKIIPTGLTELLLNETDAEQVKDILKIIRTNKVDLTTEKERQEFDIFLYRRRENISKRLKKLIGGKKQKDIIIKYIGEIVGINYIVTQVVGLPFEEVYAVNIQGKGDFNGYEAINPKYTEFLLFSLLKQLKPNDKETYYRVLEGLYIGLKRFSYQGLSYMTVAYLDKKDSVITCNKAFILKNNKENGYEPVSYEEMNSELVNILKKDSIGLADRLAKNGNLLI